MEDGFKDDGTFITSIEEVVGSDGKGIVINTKDGVYLTSEEKMVAYASKEGYGVRLYNHEPSETMWKHIKAFFGDDLTKKDWYRMPYVEGIGVAHERRPKHSLSGGRY